MILNQLYIVKSNDIADKLLSQSCSEPLNSFFSYDLIMHLLLSNLINTSTVPSKMKN